MAGLHIDFQALVQKEVDLIDSYLKSYLATLPGGDVAGIRRLLESMEYSVLGPGKRFRPLLTLLTVEALEGDLRTGLGFAAAVEMVHSYSLIHDDLPLMDDDDLRRGRPTNHKVYGEGMALLAGDGLLTEAFTSIAEAYQHDPALAIELVAILGRAAGVRGMVGGQAIDILPLPGQREEWEVRYQHNLKTGALIRCAVEGGAVIGGAQGSQRQNLDQFGKSLGLAFQIADDIMDHDPSRSEPTSFVTVLGEDATREMLGDVSRQATAALNAAGVGGSRLAELVQANLARTEVTGV